MFRSILPFAALPLVACTALVPSTVAQLLNVSPLTADPEGIAVQIDLPDGIGILPESAKLRLSNTYLGETTSGEFILAREGDIFTIAAQDVTALRDLQATIRSQEDARPQDNSGSLSVGAGPCIDGTPPSADATVSVALRLAVDGAFLPLFRDQPLSALFGDADLTSFPPCPVP